jgi:hypothetical protein
VVEVVLLCLPFVDWERALGVLLATAGVLAASLGAFLDDIASTIVDFRVFPFLQTSKSKISKLRTKSCSKKIENLFRVMLSLVK